MEGRCKPKFPCTFITAIKLVPTLVKHGSCVKASMTGQVLPQARPHLELLQLQPLLQDHHIGFPLLRRQEVEEASPLDQDL